MQNPFCTPGGQSPQCEANQLELRDPTHAPPRANEVLERGECCRGRKASFSEAIMLRCHSGRRIRSACVLAFASLVVGFMPVTQVVAQQPRRVGRLLVIDPCPPNNILSAGGRLGDIGKLAAELAAREPEMIVTQSTPAIRALIATKTTLPIVMSAPDPVGEGYAQSLARPGGNITGVAELG